MLESLCNGYKHWQSHLSSLQVEHVVFEDIGLGRGDLQSCWTALDVPPDRCHMLADRGVFWKGERLHVNSAYRDDAELLPWLYNACMLVFRVNKFSSSRWIAIGCCLRTLIAACALGIRKLHQLTVDDPKVGTYYLGGFSKLTSPMLRFTEVAAISSRPTEALSLALLVDDRAVRNLEAYEAHLQDEIDWMQNLGETV